MTFGALEDFVNGIGAKSGMQTIMQMHGCGYGDDGPLFTHRVKSDRIRDLAIEKNNAFVWKPIARSADGEIDFAFGGPVIVTDNGCESLVKREPGLVATG